MSTTFFTRSRCQIIRTKGVNKKEESNRSRSRGAQQFCLCNDDTICGVINLMTTAQNGIISF